MSGAREAPRVTGQPNRIPKFDAATLEALAKLRRAVVDHDGKAKRADTLAREGDSEKWHRALDARPLLVARAELETMLKEES